MDIEVVYRAVKNLLSLVNSFTKKSKSTGFCEAARFFQFLSIIRLSGLVGGQMMQDFDVLIRNIQKKNDPRKEGVFRRMDYMKREVFPLLVRDQQCPLPHISWSEFHDTFLYFPLCKGLVVVNKGKHSKKKIVHLSDKMAAQPEEEAETEAGSRIRPLEENGSNLPNLSGPNFSLTCKTSFQ